MAYKSSSRNKWYGRSGTSHSGRNRRIKVLPQEVSQRPVAGRPLGALEALKEELVNVNVSWLKYQIGLQQHFNHWSNATSYRVHTLCRTGGHPMLTQTNWGTASTCTLSLCFRDILSTLLMLTYTLSTLKICGCAPNGNCDANLARLPLCFHLICTSLFSATGSAVRTCFTSSWRQLLRIIHLHFLTALDIFVQRMCFCDPSRSFWVEF